MSFLLTTNALTYGASTRAFETLVEAHDALVAWATERNLDVHLHQGSWEGHALSTAFDKGGDMLYDAQAAVIRELPVCAAVGGVGVTCDRPAGHAGPHGDIHETWQ